MIKVGELSGDVVVESVLRLVDGVSEHRYRLVGGPDDGREFNKLSEVFDYARQHGRRPTDTGLAAPVK